MQSRKSTDRFSSSDTQRPGPIRVLGAADARCNQLLAVLPDARWRYWLPQLEHVEMTSGQVLCESGQTPTHVYFPTTAIVSLVSVMLSGAAGEVAVVGNEGVVGISAFMGGDSTPVRAVVRSAGEAFRLDSQAMKDEFSHSEAVLNLMLRYTQALIAQMTQTSMCNRHHSVDQQLCRCLLLTLERLRGNELLMTQELISNVLGVRREGITEAAHKLQLAGLIRYSRGHINVLDLEGLEQRACECYAVVKTEYDRLLPNRRTTLLESAANQMDG